MKFRIFGFFLAFALSHSDAFAVPNLIINGDFSLTHKASQGGKTNFGIPDSWSGITGQIDNATVKNGAMFFYTSGPNNVNYDKTYIFQSFNVTTEGNYLLSFDYQLQNPGNGTGYGGAKIFLDQMYSNPSTGLTPNIVFEQRYSTEYFNVLGGLTLPNAWHTEQKVELNLSAGSHTLYLSAGSMDLSASSRSVSFDNVSVTSMNSPAAAVSEPETYAMMLAGLGLIGGIARRHNQKLSAKYK